MTIAKQRLKTQASLIGVALMVLLLAVSVGPRCHQGPYLQSPTTNSVVIRWRTTSLRPIQCVLKYWSDPGNQSHELRSAPLGDAHEVLLSNLLPGTRYNYSIHTRYRQIAGGERFRFQTLPIPGAIRPVRVWVLGDSGTGNERARSVREGFQKFAGNRPADLILMLGDNAYEKGSRFDHHKGLFLPYREYLWSTPIWPSLGNHDVMSRGTAPGTNPFHDFFTLPQHGQSGGVASGRESYYSFDWANIHIVCLDSTDITSSNYTTMTAWLARDLQASVGQDWLIAFWHHPPYSMGHHDSDIEPESRTMRMLPLTYLEMYGADMVLCGHNHNYGRTQLLYNHTGDGATFNPAVHNVAQSVSRDHATYRKPSPRRAGQGTIYVVAGCSGKLEQKPLDHPAMSVKLNLAGSVVVDVEASTLDCLFVDEQGTPRDAFRIVKDNFSASNR